MKQRDVKGKALFIIDAPADVSSYETVISELAERDDVEMSVITQTVSTAKYYEGKGIPCKYFSSGQMKKTKHIFDAENPDVLLVGSDTREINICFALVAKRENVPIISIPHGIGDYLAAGINKRTQFNHIIHNLPRSLFDILDRRQCLYNFSPHFILDYIKIYIRYLIFGSCPGQTGCMVCVLGNEAKEDFVRRGINPAKIVVTGQPRFDAHFNLRSKGAHIKSQICGYFNVPPQRKIVLLITQPFLKDRLWQKEYDDRFLEYIIEGVRKVEGTQLIIKIHPRENKERYTSFLQELGIVGIPVVAEEEFPLSEWLSACDVVLNVASTVVIEAAIADKPVITLDWADGTPEFYLQNGIVINVKPEEDLSQSVELVLQDSKTRESLAGSRSQFVSEYIGQLGTATEKVVNLITRAVIESREDEKR